MKTPSIIYSRILIGLPRIALLVFIALFDRTPLPAQNYIPTFPPGHSSTDGNSFSTIPFSAGSNTVRFQQVYDAAGFIAERGNIPYLIHQISFREGAGRREGFSSHFTDFQVNLSTTVRTVDGLSLSFAENVGTAERVIVPRGSFRIGVSVAVPFSAVISLPTPFLYDPSQGNLLLDIRNFGGGATFWGYPPFLGPAHVDASNVVGDRVSSVFGTVDSPTGMTSTLGLVTQFWITPVTKLTVFQQSSKLLFRWVRIHSQDGFMLQQSAMMDPGAAWQPVGGIVTTNGAYKEVTLPLNTNAVARFFRLVWAPSSAGSAGTQTTTSFGTILKQEP